MHPHTYFYGNNKALRLYTRAQFSLLEGYLQMVNLAKLIDLKTICSLD